MTSDQFGDNIDETDMKYLLKKPVLLTKFNWPSTSPVGTVLYTTINSPKHYLCDGDTVKTSPFSPTILGFLSTMFTYWRGSINLTFQVVGTAFHEGRLDFCNHPATIVAPTDYAAAMSQYVNSQTIRNTNNTVRIRIPFHSDMPWKRVWNGETLADDFGSGGVRSTDFVTGCFSVRVSVPLKSPSNVANNVDVNVFVSAGDDFEFHTLSVYGGCYQLITPTFRNEVNPNDSSVVRHRPIKTRREAGDLNTDANTDKDVICLGVGKVYTKDPAGASVHFGESYSNLREMCKRYQHCVGSTASTALVAGDNIAALTINAASLPGIMGFLFNSFRLFRGPMNFKFQLQTISTENLLATPQINGFITNIPFFPTAASGLSTSNSPPALSYTMSNNRLNPPLVRFSTNQVAEFVLPYQSIYHSLINPIADEDYEPFLDNMYTNFMFAYAVHYRLPLDAQANIFTEVAFGDETRVGVFVGCPKIMQNGGAWWPNPSTIG